MPTRALGWSLCLICLSGCAVVELEKDQDRIRTALLDLYTNQILDNLIRAHDGLPIIQMDYANATATVTMKETASGNDPAVTTSSNALTLAAANTALVTRTFVNTITGSLGLDHTNQIALLATPVTTSDAVYDAYVHFVRNGGLRVSCQAPPEGAAHLCKKCGHTYYWVPIEYQREFLRLALVTTAQRAQPAAPADTFYSVNIIKVLTSEDTSGAESAEPTAKQPVLNPLTPPAPTASATKRKYWLTLKIDRKIPIDNGRIDVSSSDKTASKTPTSSSTPTGKSGAGGKGDTGLTGKGAADAKNTTGSSGTQGASQGGMLSIFGQPAGQKRRSGTTDVLQVFFDEEDPPSNFKDLKTFVASVDNQPVPAKIYLNRHRPLAAVETNNRVEFYLQQLQQGQFRNGNGGF
jgi:hypothetical protein